MSDNAQEDVLFIHGFISTSKFWTETLFPNFSSATKSTYRMFAIDLLGFGRSPKPTDCLYTLKDHLDMIERSVLEPNKVKSFHIVAHSLGCILALALTEKHPGCVKSLTLLAPVSSCILLRSSTSSRFQSICISNIVFPCENIYDIFLWLHGSHITRCQRILQTLHYIQWKSWLRGLCGRRLNWAQQWRATTSIFPGRCAWSCARTIDCGTFSPNLSLETGNWSTLSTILDCVNHVFHALNQLVTHFQATLIMH